MTVRRMLWLGGLCLLAACRAEATDEQAQSATSSPQTLAVCADPDNLPYSNAKEEGFENRIATLLADDLHAELRYVWSKQRRSFFRLTLLAGLCDVVISVPQSLGVVAATRPYFTSRYVAVTRRRENLLIASFDDPNLRTLRIGLQMVGAEGANPPPAMALGRRGITEHLTGFPMWASETEPNPQAKIVDAVASGAVDVAFVWGPFAGYFAKPYGDQLRIDPIAGDPGMPELAFSYGMAIGVRKADTALRDRLQLALDRHRADIDGILRDFSIPLVPGAAHAPAKNSQ